ncbi:MAG: hypothetical protein WKF66_11070 [Pedobacter sp.]
MENRDYLLKQLEAFGEALRRLRSKVSLLKESDATDIEVAEIDELMKAVIGINLQDIANLTNEDFLDVLLEKKLKGADLSNVINLLVDLAKVKRGMQDKYNSNQLLSKALFLGNYLASQKMAFFENIKALDEARKLLK